MKKHTQIIKFTDGSKKTIKGVIEITEGDLTKLTTDKGVEYLINKDNVLWVIKGTADSDIEENSRKSNLRDEEDYDEPVSNSTI